MTIGYYKTGTTKWLRVGGKGVISRACCCRQVCVCGANLPATFKLTVTILDSCCSGGPVDGLVVNSNAAIFDTETQCCYWDKSFGTGNPADCPTPGPGWGFRTTYCQATGMWTVGPIPGLGYCAPDTTSWLYPQACGSEPRLFYMKKTGLVSTINGCCDTTFDITWENITP